MQRWVVMGLSLWLLAWGAAAQTRGDQAFTCQRAASKIDGLIEDWHAMVLEYQAEAKNPSVLQMWAEHRKGRLKTNFQKHCNRQWENHQAIFVCFSGSVTELGLALCRQVDTNPNDWQYKP
ncbi:hypothetical protein [Rhodoferax sp. TS-BS-61-7]|uniref:hypothetical protein n=1 Tax=Rhodoferax sp. TS-BS-61-7 TaxID=2094194 RepID=UPI000CF5DFFA|nr:hypothetical protein [Rhodoferax sp. TS-BS-61-7]PQA77671.1 hypothetical protein C5F53_10610 [Rhodoferax sp. TS-BS-61-7]